MSYKIGSFNLRDFNFSNKSGEEEIHRNFSMIAHIILEEQFDVVAIQEINASLPLEHLTAILNKHKNIMREYQCNFGENMPTHSKDPERYGFIWNCKRLRLLSTLKNNNPRYYTNAGANELIRPPYYARFTARGLLGGSNFELRLINVHIRDATREEDRIQEFNTLVKQVLPRICDHCEISSDGECMPAYTFLLGDYNIILNKSEQAIYRIDKITSTQYTGKRRDFLTVQEAKTSLKYPKPDSQITIEDCYASNYDHFTYEIDLETKLVLTPQRIEVLGKYFKNRGAPADMLKSYRQEISDHVPIAMKISLK